MVIGTKFRVFFFNEILALRKFCLFIPHLTNEISSAMVVKAFESISIFTIIY